jgi:hypothetical protein
MRSQGLISLITGKYNSSIGLKRDVRAECRDIQDETAAQPGVCVQCGPTEYGRTLAETTSILKTNGGNILIDEGMAVITLAEQNVRAMVNNMREGAVLGYCIRM